MSRYALRKSVGPLSAGTPVRILEQGDTWADITTEAPMPHIPLAGDGFVAIYADRPIITGLDPDYLVRLRRR